MDLFLGFDGGGSGCRAAIADASGNILARAEGGAANIAPDPAGARANIIAVAERAMARAGTRKLTAAALGLAGANAAGASAIVEGALPADRVRIETDAVTAAIGALGARDGVVAAIGTGAVYALRRGDGIRQTGGRGLILGDEGAGAWLGREALAAALRAEDGVSPGTPWLTSLIERHGGEGGVIAFAQTARPADFAVVAPEVIANAARDEAAAAIMKRAEESVADAITALRRGAEHLPVAFIGGLGAHFAGRLRGHFPVIAPLGGPLEGALTLARQLL